MVWSTPSGEVLIDVVTRPGQTDHGHGGGGALAYGGKPAAGAVVAPPQPRAPPAAPYAQPYSPALRLHQPGYGSAALTFRDGSYVRGGGAVGEYRGGTRMSMLGSGYLPAPAPQPHHPPPADPPPFKKIRFGVERPPPTPLPVHQPLRVDTRVPVNAYNAVELSPNPPSEPTAEDSFRTTKDDLLQQISKVDREMALSEATLAKLKKKQEELEQTASKPARAEEPEEAVPRHRSLAQCVYADNRKKVSGKAASAHALLSHLGPQTLYPVYNQPQDTPVYHENIRRHRTFRKRLAAHIHRLRREAEKREDLLAEAYSRRAADWLRRVERIEQGQKRKVKDARNREFFEKVFPELRKQREERERFNRLGARVKSEAELEEIADGLHEQEHEDKKMRALTVVPPLLRDPRDTAPVYVDTNRELQYRPRVAKVIDETGAGTPLDSRQRSFWAQNIVNRLGARVKSEAELEEIADGLHEQEHEDKKMRALTVVPPLLRDPRDTAPVYVDTNLCACAPHTYWRALTNKPRSFWAQNIVNRLGARVKSEAELEEIADGLHEQEHEDKKMRALTVVPPLLRDPRDTAPVYVDTNPRLHAPEPVCTPAATPRPSTSTPTFWAQNIVNRLGARVKSEAELEEIADGLHEQEHEDKKMRALTVVPPLLRDPRDTAPVYVDTNRRCMDMESEHKELQLRNVWSQSEREVFREKYLQHPKNFGQIASFLPRKSVRDCVRFYYLSKKAENYKQLLRKPRQRRSARNPPRPAPEPDLPAGVTTRLQRSQGATARSVDNKEPSLDETGLAAGVSCILPTAAPQPARTELRTPPLIPSPPPASSAPGGAPSVADSPPTPPPLELTPDTPLPPLPPMPPPTTCEAMMTTTVVTTSSSPTSVPSPLPATSLAPATVAPAASSPAPVSLSAAAVSSIPTPPPGSAPPTPQPPPTPTQPPPTPETDKKVE
ncbi:nuclear receptor corepressor 1-like [Ostrinia nubilalis]|uniref:nuclear receptor corepressor 1-like n=1 Tax=Ostrinia nubilalis TaxID=29057 RepID=UPI003082409D